MGTAAEWWAEGKKVVNGYEYNKIAPTLVGSNYCVEKISDNRLFIKENNGVFSNAALEVMHDGVRILFIDVMTKVSNVILGHNVVIRSFVNMFGCEVGSNVKVGSNTIIESGVKIGTGVKIQSGVFIAEGTVIEDGVFIGPHVTILNDKFPIAAYNNGTLYEPSDWRCEPAILKRGCSIGGGATICPGVVVGSDVLVGAGSVVTHNCEANAIYMGSPAKFWRAYVPSRTRFLD